jgi:hypothetical protein
MSQSQPTASAPASTPRRNWLRPAALITGLLVLVVIAFAMFVSDQKTRRELDNARMAAIAAQQHAQVLESVRLRDANIALAVPATGSPLPPVPADVLRTRVHLVRLQINFADFEQRMTTALVIEQLNGSTYLTAAREAFAPVTGKLNGRVVTRRASGVTVVETGSSVTQLPPGMGATMAGPMGGMPGAMGPASFTGGFPSKAMTVDIDQPLPNLGLTLLKTGSNFSPLRVLGEFARTTTGDQLTVVSLNSNPGAAQRVEVLGVDESMQMMDGQRVDHVLKLTACESEAGSIVCNGQGEPIGQIVSTSPKTASRRVSYAVPIAQIYQAIYAGQLTDDQAGATGNPPVKSPDPTARPVEEISTYDLPQSFNPFPPGKTGNPPAPALPTGAPPSVDHAPPEGPGAASPSVAPNNAGFLFQGMMSGPPAPAPSREEAEMETQSRQLAARLQAATPADQPPLRRELEQLTDRHFELRQQQRRREIDELSGRLDKLRAAVERRQQHKSDVIQRRIQELLDPGADLGWEKPVEQQVPPVPAETAKPEGAMPPVTP